MPSPTRYNIHSFVFLHFCNIFAKTLCVPSRNLGRKAKSMLSKSTRSYSPFTYPNTNLSPRTTMSTVLGGWLRRSPLTRPQPLRSTLEAPFSSTSLRTWPILKHITKALGRRSGDRLVSSRRYEWCFLWCFICIVLLCCFYFCMRFWLVCFWRDHLMHMAGLQFVVYPVYSFLFIIFFLFYSPNRVQVGDEWMHL